MEHVRVAFELAGLKPYWTFAIGVGPNGEDDGTRHIVTELFRNEPGIWTEITEPPIPEHRTWHEERYQQLADYRNRLLGLIQGVRPDYFLSLDSDMLLHPAALLCMLDMIENHHPVQGDYAAIGGKAYLSESGTNFPTYATLNNAGLIRSESSGTFPVEILMAIKLMSPAAYNIPYKSHMFGEDIGWSLNCKEAGLVLGWDGRVTSKHVMRKDLLDKVDERVGW